MKRLSQINSTLLTIILVGNIGYAQNDGSSTSAETLTAIPSSDLTTGTTVAVDIMAPEEDFDLGTPTTAVSTAPQHLAIQDTAGSAPASVNSSDPASTPTHAVDDPTSVSTPEGVVYQVLKPGTGPVEHTTQTLLLHYTLYLSDGTKLESSREQEFPTPLKLRRNTDSFIRGFEIGTVGMRVGEVRKLYIPANLAYGEKGTEAVPPNTPLVFVAELVDLK